MISFADNKKLVRKILPILGVIFALTIQILIPNHRRHPDADFHYYEALLFLALAVFAVLLIVSFFSKKLSEKLAYFGPFCLGAGIFFGLLDLITAKKNLLPALLFPSFDNVLSVFVDSHSLIVKCVLYSCRLMGVGVFWGIIIGFLTGVLLGFSKRANYWLNPVIKVIGPIPATAWIPIALFVFPTTFGASAFIIGLAVWFPVVLMTGNGIQNVPNVYFEVGKTLGAKYMFQVFRIAIPAALPSIFQGIFFGIVSAFIALMTGEMFGARFGIGWYISMEKEMAEYKGVYAGLILIALFCSIIITLVFKVRARVLRWQKGLVKW